MCGVVDGRTEEDEPKRVKSAEMACEETVCDECADHVVGEEAAEGQFVFPSWNGFFAFVDGEPGGCGCGGGHGG